jgi:aspartate racemase
MKTIGLIGGMSWESSAEYYRIINQEVRRRCGELASAQSLMFSFNFEEIEALQKAGDWNTATQRMIEAAQMLERGGAGCIVICTNTMHKMAEAVQSAVNLPLIHIADATAEKIREAGVKTVGLLATAYTMEQDFYKGRLIDNYDLNVLVPDDTGRKIVHRIIYDELCQGVVKPGSKAAYQRVIDDLVAQGAEAIILGCTEITLLIKQDDCPVPVFDTTAIHAVAAVDWALS